MNLFRVRAVFVFTLATVLRAAGPCPMPRDVQPGTTLEDLARVTLGDPRYAIAIALATNARTADGFGYIANPDDITNVKSVCIPSKSEAGQLEKAWRAYDHAVSAARLPRMANVSKTLLTIPPDQPVDVVAWVRKDQAEGLKTASGGWVTTALSETWVTVEPHLRTFCSALVRDQHADEARLTGRLEQRLGLSPSSNKTQVVRIRVERPGPGVIFRPCVDPATDHAACPVGPPSKAPLAHQQWLYRQYYSSYGQSLLSEFPWTALGYTFDWASAGKPSQFQRNGESEFVINKGAQIEILEAVTTSQYCAPTAP